MPWSWTYAPHGRPDSPDGGTILRAVFWHSIAIALLVAGFAMPQAYVFASTIVR
jgi:hypothetical protein